MKVLENKEFESYNTEAKERFKNNIDKHADGTAAFVAEAITYFVNK